MFSSFEFASLSLGDSDMDIITSLITKRESCSPLSGHLCADVLLQDFSKPEMPMFMVWS